jgi:ABC-type lipoprotein export system ATPase subunit
MVTHERDVSAIADRVVTLSDGRVIGNEVAQRATPKQVRELRHA